MIYVCSPLLAPARRTNQEASMTKSAKVLLGIATIFPFLYMIFFFVFVFSLAFSPRRFDNFDRVTLESQFSIIFLLHILTILLVTGLTIFYTAYLRIRRCSGPSSYSLATCWQCLSIGIFIFGLRDLCHRLPGTTQDRCTFHTALQCRAICRRSIAECTMIRHRRRLIGVRVSCIAAIS